MKRSSEFVFDILKNIKMKLYAATRILRGVALGAAIGSPLSAIVTETISYVTDVPTLGALGTYLVSTIH